MERKHQAGTFQGTGRWQLQRSSETPTTVTHVAAQNICYDYLQMTSIHSYYHCHNISDSVVAARSYTSNDTAIQACWLTGRLNASSDDCSRCACYTTLHSCAHQWLVECPRSDILTYLHRQNICCSNTKDKSISVIWGHWVAWIFRFNFVMDLLSTKSSHPCKQSAHLMYRGPLLLRCHTNSKQSSVAKIKGKSRQKWPTFLTCQFELAYVFLRRLLLQHLYCDITQILSSVAKIKGKSRQKWPIF